MLGTANKMSLLISALLRLITIFFALFVAILAAGLMFGYALASGLVPEIIIEGQNSNDVEYIILTVAAIGLGAMASFNLAGLLGIPLIISILATEMMRWQSMTVHLVLGGLVALFVMFTQLPENVTPQEGTIIVTLAAGFIAAFFYWLIAGRNAGNWMGPITEKPQPPKISE